jgi:hypothetical protein
MSCSPVSRNRQLPSLPATSETGAPGTNRRSLRRDEASSRGRSRADSRLRRGDGEVMMVNPGNDILYTPLPSGAASGLVEPRRVVVPLRRVLRPRQRVGRVTEYRPGLEDLYLPAAERRRAGAQLGPPGVRSRVGQLPGSRPGPGRARLLMPTSGGDFGSGWTGRCCRHAPRHRRLGSLGRTGPLAARALGASRAYRSTVDAGRPAPPLGPRRSVTGADQAITAEDSARSSLQVEIRRKSRARSARPAR